MKLKDVTELFYSIYLYKVQGYDCQKYGFKLPSTYSKTIQTFFEYNKFEIQELSRYSKGDVVLKSILSIFIYNKGKRVIRISDKEYEKFKYHIQYYMNEIDLFINNFNKFNINSYIDVYVLYSQKKIPFYIFFYFLRYIKYDETFSDKELIKNKFIEVHKLMKFFKHFNEENIKDRFKELQKVITLNTI